MTGIPATQLHHVHVFSADVEETVKWWTRMLGATVAFDGELAGARNVFVRVGAGRLHIYDQSPPGGKSAVHHIGIRTADLAALTDHMRRQGVVFRSEIREFGNWRYVMVAAPDNVLLELFEANDDRMEGDAKRYFADTVS